MANEPDTVNPAPFPAPSPARNPHAGHRSRMRSKALTYGLDHLDDHEVLEMLLYHAIPRGDTNETAHRLLERFGSFRGLLEAPPEELQAVPGVGESAAVLLKLTMEAARRYYAARRTRRLHLTSTEAIGRFLTPVFIGRREENVYLLCLDAKKTPVYGRIITVGGVAASTLEIQQILSTAVSVQAKYVVLAHNHPSGYAVPSESDLQTTLQLKHALAGVNICLLDHLIIADPTGASDPTGDYVSLADSNLI